MATTSKGNNSAMHPRMKMTWKRAIKIEKIARLSLDPRGYTNEQIANHLNCDKQTVVLIRQLPEYHAKMLEVLSGVTSQYDQDLRQDTDNSRSELKSMVPSAMMVIRNALFSPNESVRMKAAIEVFDREGTHAKVSKSSVTVNTAPDMKVDPQVSNNLLELLMGAPVSVGSSAGTGGGGFTSTAAQASKQQITMAEDTSIEALEAVVLDDSKPN